MAIGMSSGGGGGSTAVQLLEALANPAEFQNRVEQFQKVSDQAAADKEAAAQSILDAKNQVNELLGKARMDAGEIIQKANDDAQGILAGAEAKAKEIIGKANEMYADYQALKDKEDARSQALEKKDQSLAALANELGNERQDLDKEKAEIERKKALLSQL